MSKVLEESSKIIQVFNDGSKSVYEVSKSQSTNVYLESDGQIIVFSPESWEMVKAKVDLYFSNLSE
jgi:hypothetical protein